MDEHSGQRTVVPRRDHLWVLFVVAACALGEVWGSWVSIGSSSGFPYLGPIPTDWTLAVVVEAYWGYALYAWLGTAAGPRSRKFAMWSAGAVFALSIVGQAASHLTAGNHKTPPPAVVVFVTSLPVLVLALIAVLIHLRHLDRDEVAEVAEESALRAELAQANTARETAECELTAVRMELTEAVAKTETLARKLDGNGTRKRSRATGRKPARKPVSATGREGQPVTVPEGGADVDREALVLRYLSEGYSASKAGVMAGLSDSRGRQIARELAKTAPADTVDGDGGTA